ncbi:CidA/LrgA family protein [Psychrobacter aestuarii]|uniref:CidA/LrgA family protein n=1 Tax=Psychrobacter aestuarii TaxID=556327 RepID=A0ABN0VL49_9GAMM|nr:CidA/LrgA family protein [Psychrobacter aestuarii]
MTTQAATALPRWAGIVITLALVILVRESAVLICSALGIDKAANIVGMVVMFALLMLWRWRRGLPSWLTGASNVLLVDSGFAFLPVSAGAGIILLSMGNELWAVLATVIISTLLPMWGLAHLAQRSLKDTPSAQTRPPQRGQS